MVTRARNLPDYVGKKVVLDNGGSILVGQLCGARVYGDVVKVAVEIFPGLIVYGKIKPWREVTIWEE